MDSSSNLFLTPSQTDKTSLRVRMLQISFSNSKSAKWLDTALLFIEYMQLISQLFLLSYGFYQNGDHYSLKTIMLPIAKVFSLGYLLDMNQENKGFIVYVLAVLFGLCILKYTLCFYILILSREEKRGNNFLIWLWRWIVKTQSRALYFFVTSFWTNIIFAVVKEEIKISPLEEKGWIAWGVVAIILEVLFTIFTQFYLVLIVPRKDFLASKSNHLEIVNIFQKCIIQILQLILTVQFENLWGYFIIHMILSMLRYRIYFITLPRYKLQALFYQAIFLALDFSFGISFLMQTIISKSSYKPEVSINFAILSWVILSLLMSQLNIAILDKIIIKVITENDLNNFSHTIHRVHILEEIRNQDRNIPGFLVRYQRICLVDTVLSKCFHQIFDKNQDSQELKKLYSNSLSALVNKFPKNNFVKLIAGFYYIRKFNMIYPGIKLLNHLNQNSSSINNFSVNAAFILRKQQNAQIKQYDKSKLNLSTYLKHLSNMNDFKNEILKQIQAQESLYLQILNNSPDLSKIFDAGQFIHKIRSTIDKRTTTLFKTFPEYYLEPLVLALFYDLILNFSAQDNQKLIQLIQRRSQKYLKSFHSEKFCEENLYQRENCFLIISGNREDPGKILFSSKNANQTFGQDLTGKYHYDLMIPFVRSQMTEKSKRSQWIQDSLDQEIEAFCYNNKNGCVFPVNYYMNIHPFMTQGLNYILIVRPMTMISEKGYIILSENGDIQGFSKEIGRKLKLFSGRRKSSSEDNHITKLSPQFEGIVFDREDIPSNQILIDLIPLNSDEEGSSRYPYHCLIESKRISGIQIFVLTLEKITSAADHVEENPYIRPQQTEFFFEDERIFSLFDEKASGWIDFSRLTDVPIATKQIVTTTLADVQRTEFEILASPTSQKLLLTAHEEKEHHQEPFSPSFRSHQHHHRNNPGARDLFLEQLSTSSKTNSSSTVLAKIYHISLSTKYYPPFYRVLIIAIYIIFLALIAQQIVFRVTLNDYFKNLKAGKDVLRVSETRNNQLIEVHRHARYLWSLGPARNLPPLFYTVDFAFLLADIGPRIVQLSETNQELIAAANFLSENSRKILFQRDVRFFETDETDKSYSNMTNFQACDRITETALRFYQVAQYNQAQAVPYMDSVMRNSLNDLLLKAMTTAEYYLSALDEQRKENNTHSTIIFALSLAFEAAVTMFFGAAVYQQYKSEKRNMSAFVRVNKKMVEKVFGKVAEFKTKIHEGTRFDNPEDGKDILFNTYMSIRSRPSVTNLSGPSKKEVSHPKSQGIVWKYQMRFFQMVSVFLFVSILTILNFVNGKNYVNNLFAKALNVHNADQIQPNLALGQTSFIDLATTNDTSIIENMAPSLAVADSISVIADIRNNQLPSLKNEDGTFDPTIKNVLYGDACKYSGEVYHAYCLKNAKGASDYGLIQMITNYEQVIVNVNQQYHEAEVKSEDVLEDLLFQAYASSVASMSFLKIFTTVVADVMNQKFEDYYNARNSKFNTLNTVYLVLLAVTCLVIHFLMVNRLRESENQYRRVLQTLPPNIILGNPFVKAYLRNSSRALFSSISTYS